MTCGQASLHSEWHVTRPSTNLLLPVHSHSKTSYMFLVSANKMVRSKPGKTMYLLGQEENGSLPLIWRLDRFHSANGMETDMNLYCLDLIRFLFTDWIQCLPYTKPFTCTQPLITFSCSNRPQALYLPVQTSEIFNKPSRLRQ